MSSLTLREVRGSQETKIKMWKRRSNCVSLLHEACKYTFFMLIQTMLSTDWQMSSEECKRHRKVRKGILKPSGIN